MKEAKAAGWREIGILGRVYNLIIHIRVLEARWNKFKTLTGQLIPLDNDTQWNLWYTVLEAIKSEKVWMVIDMYCRNWYKEVKDDCLLLEDWNIIDEMYTFLKPFYEVTMMN